MFHSTSDYSQLIDAILRDDRMVANQLASSLLDRVVLYLKVRMGAPQSVAEECAFQAFSDVFEMIRRDKILDRKSILKYFITAARNEYLRLMSKEQKNEQDIDENDYSLPQPADQLENLIDEERQNQLDKCLDRLSEKHKQFILAIFSSKSVSLTDIAQSFGFSYAKTRTLKTRIIQNLQECVKKNQ